MRLLLELLENPLISLIVGLVGGYLAGVPSGLRVERIKERRKQREQIRQVSARLVEVMVPTPDSGPGRLSRVLEGGRLVVMNNSEWPVREVYVVEPRSLVASPIEHLGPGESHEQVFTAAELGEVGWPFQRVTLEIEDVGKRRWRWTPSTGELSPIPEPIPVHSRVVQWLAKLSPERANRLLFRLPPGLRNWLWGSDPVG